MATQRLLETERLYLRPTCEEDAPLLFYLMNTPKWIKYIGNRNITSFEKAGKYILQRIAPHQTPAGLGGYTIFRKGDGKKLGVCGLYQRNGLPGVDVGFALLPKYERRGFAFEAARALIDQAFSSLGVEKVYAICSPENIASQRLLLKLGLKTIGTVFLKEENQSMALFEIVKEEPVIKEQPELS